MNSKFKRIEQLEKHVQTDSNLKEEVQTTFSDFIKNVKKKQKEDLDNKELWQSILTKVRKYQRNLLKSSHSISPEWYSKLFEAFSEAELRLLAREEDNV